MDRATDESELQISNAFAQLGFPSIKPEQRQVVRGILQRDVFAVLPTGFGKSACYQCLPFLYNQRFPADDPCIVLVVTPLTAIMKDQVAALSHKGVKSCYMSSDQDSEDVKAGIIRGEYQVVYFTPEKIIAGKRWREMLVGEVYSRRLKTFVIDEAHTVKKWGETFRKLLLRIGEIRSLLPSNVNIMALTATASKQLRIDVSRIIGMSDELVVAKPPSKPNIMYTVGTFSTIEETFLPIVKKVERERARCPRMIIYCRNYQDCADLYIFFKGCLGVNFTEPPGAPDLPRFRLVDMYMSCTDPVVKEDIVSLFTRESTLRIVVATVAFGMGLDCPNVRQVIHFGPPNDIESYVQETGRAGRDNLQSLAVLIKKPSSGRYIEKTMARYMSNDIHCRRDNLFEHFDLYSRTFDGPLCLCCDVCLKSCKCSHCCSNHQSFVFV